MTVGLLPPLFNGDETHRDDKGNYTLAKHYNPSNWLLTYFRPLVAAASGVAPYPKVPDPRIVDDRSFSR